MENNNNENPQKTMQFSKILIAILFLFIMFGAGLIIGKMASSNETNTIAHSQEDKKYNNAKNETSTTLNEYNNTEEDNTNIEKEELTNTTNETKEDTRKTENTTKENTTNTKNETQENKKPEQENENTFIKTSEETAPDVNTKTQLTSLKGKYKFTSETENNYHNATINILEQNDSTIKFEISAVNGKDIDHVNIGELEGTAKKVGINQYVYEETIDGTTHKITFVFDAHRIFEWVTISESYYPDNNNPFAGHGVYFTGEYEKVEN